MPNNPIGMFNRFTWASIALHLLGIWVLLMSGFNLFNAQILKNDPFHELAQSLSVRNISEKEFENEIKAREKLRKTEQIVQMDENLKTSEAPTTLKEKIYLSKFNQKTDQNTQAPRIGKFKNVLDEGIAQPTPTRRPTSILSHPNDVKINASTGKEGQGLSATDDYLKGVSIGPNTLLNTQEFKYYGFYERIRELLVDRWKTHIQREIAMQRGLASENRGLSTGSKITSLIVKLDEKGFIKGIEKVGLSGIERFDKAAIQSFHEAAPFPHPPQEMLKDGTLDIRWDFVVMVDEASLFEFKVSRGL